MFEADIGTNSNQYTITSADVGKKINVEVSFTDLGNYDEGPLLSETYPHGDVVIATIEDDLLVSNIGHPTQATIQATTKVGQIFGTGTNPNGYEITSVTVSGNTATVKICRFYSYYQTSPSSECQDNPSTDNPAHLRRDWLYSIVIDPNTVGVTDIDEEDQTSLPNWFIKGKYQVQNQQGTWQQLQQQDRCHPHRAPRKASITFHQTGTTDGHPRRSAGNPGMAKLDSQQSRCHPEDPIPGEAGCSTMEPRLDGHTRQQ